MGSIERGVMSIFVVLSLLLRWCFGFQPIPVGDGCIPEAHGCRELKVEDFSYSGLQHPGNLSLPTGVRVHLVNNMAIPGLYGQDISMGNIIYPPQGNLPPHLHHKGPEMITVLYGTLEVGFITSGSDFVHYKKILTKGDVIIIPHGVVHYQHNLDNGETFTIFTSGAMNQGLVTTTHGIFGAKPKINAEFLSKAFHLDTKIVKHMQTKLSISK